MGTGSVGSGPAGSDAASFGTAYSSGGTTPLSATTQLASNSVPAGGTAAKQVYRGGSHFPLTKLLPQVVKAPRAMGDRVLKVGTITADLPVAPGEHKRSPPSGRPVSRCLIRWLISPLGHLPTFPQLQHLKVPCPNRAVVQELYLAILKGWPLNTGVLGGRRTLNMPSRFTIDIMLPLSRSQNGQR